MKESSEAPSPCCRSESKKLQLRSSKTHSPLDSVQLSTQTPEKLPERVCNRCVAISIAEIRKVSRGQQDRKQCHDTTSLETKTAKRQILMPSPCKTKNVTNEIFKLPEKYEILGEFFDSLDSSIRLLRLKGLIRSFTNTSRKIECLTDRRFTHGHLAQLKFVLPEAIVVKKILVFDEHTSCMKPDLHVDINPDAVEFDSKFLPHSGSLLLRKLFRTRLRDYCESHPEVDEIPEETLPEPFNRPTLDPFSDMLKTPSLSLPTKTLFDVCAAHHQAIVSARGKSNDIPDNAVPTIMVKNFTVPVKTTSEEHNQHPAVASHMPLSFKMQFSQKSKENEADNIQKKFPLDPLESLAFLASESSLKKNPPFEGTESHPITFPAELASKAASSEICTPNRASTRCFTSSDAPPATPSKTIVHTENKDESLKSVDTTTTPAKLLCTPYRLMTATPALPAPKRCYMSPDDNSTNSPNKLVRRLRSSRSLKFDSPVKNKETRNENNAGGLPIGDDIFDILPENLLQSIGEKERIAMEERDPAISQAKRRKKMIASLPKLFNMIHLLFHSINRSIITKEELASKIISSHCDIVDKSEVEEQLSLFLELVPEWISEKLASSGDYLFCINKMLNPDTIRASLEEAK